MSETLPHSPKAEQALLGILLHDNQAIERIPDFFQAEHLHDPVHARICGALLASVQGGGLADPITLMERLQGDEAFEQMGGFEYLADLVDKAPAGAGTADFCHLISDYAIRRELIRRSEEVASRALKDRATPALQMVDDLERDLYGLTKIRESSGLREFSDVIGATLENAAQAYAREDSLAGLSTGLIDLDKKLGGMKKQDVIVLAARPSMGKTALATNIAFQVARTYEPGRADDGSPIALRGGVVAFFSLEMSAEQLGLRILADVSGINSERIQKGDFDAIEFGRMRDAAMEIAASPLYIDATGGITLAAIATRCRRLKRTVGLDLVVIDYLQLVTMGVDMPTTERVTKVSQGLKALAKELNVPVLALAQLVRKVEDRSEKKPQLSDLKDSGSIEQDADVVAFVHREAYYVEREQPKEGSAEYLKWEEDLDACRHIAEVIIGKQRHGPTGTVKLAFKGETTKFSDLPREEAA